MVMEFKERARRIKEQARILAEAAEAVEFGEEEPCNIFPLIETLSMKIAQLTK